MENIVRWLRFVWFWISFPLVTALLFSRVMIEHYILTLKGEKDTSLRAHAIAAIWGRSILQMMPGWSYEIRGEENLPKSGVGAVIVANHSSGIDICAVYATGIQFRWLSKDAVFKLPLIGQAMKWAGYVPVSRGQADSHKKAMAASANWIRRGIPMLFFPEGTRSDDGQFKAFKTGAFRLADNEGVDVYPIVLAGTNRMAKARTLMPNKAHVIIQVLPVVSRQADETFQSYMQRCRDIMMEHHQQLNDELDRMERRAITGNSTNQSKKPLVE